jgi:hypothetical protein
LVLRDGAKEKAITFECFPDCCDTLEPFGRILAVAETLPGRIVLVDDVQAKDLLLLQGIEKSGRHLRRDGGIVGGVLQLHERDPSQRMDVLVAVQIEGLGHGSIAVVGLTAIDEDRGQKAED